MKCAEQKGEKKMASVTLVRSSRVALYSRLLTLYGHIKTAQPTDHYTATGTLAVDGCPPSLLLVVPNVTAINGQCTNFIIRCGTIIASAL